MAVHVRDVGDSLLVGCSFGDMMTAGQHLTGRLLLAPPNKLSPVSAPRAREERRIKLQDRPEDLHRILEHVEPEVPSHAFQEVFSSARMATASFLVFMRTPISHRERTVFRHGCSHGGAKISIGRRTSKTTTMTGDDLRNSPETMAANQGEHRKWSRRELI